MVMPAKQGLRSGSLAVGQDCKLYAPGSYDLVADSPDGRHCARAVVFLGAGNFTRVFNADGVDRGPWAGLPAGFTHECDTSYIEVTASVAVYW